LIALVSYAYQESDANLKFKALYILSYHVTVKLKKKSKEREREREEEEEEKDRNYSGKERKQDKRRVQGARLQKLIGIEERW